MTATISSPDFDYRDVSNENSKMFNSCNNSLCGAPMTPAPCTPTESLLDRKVVVSPSEAGLFQRRHASTLPSAKFGQTQFVNNFKNDPSVLLGSSSSNNNKENYVHQCLSSELGDRLWTGSQAQVNLSRYKTELCRPFEENSVCKYGEKCQFAHGINELRSLSRHPKYKTELCRTFHTIGFCPYGPRCHFIHNAEERRGPPPLSAFNKMDRPRLQHSFSFAGFPSSSSQQETPTSVTPPPMFCADNPTNPLAYSSQEFSSLFEPSLASPTASEPPGMTPLSPTAPCFFQPMSESSPSPPDSLCDQEGYQSSLSSQSDSESPILDASRRLPIFSSLSVSDD